MTLEEILLKDIEFIDNLTEEEWEKCFEEMGGKKIETPHGTLLIIEHPLMKENMNLR